MQDIMTWKQNFSQKIYLFGCNFLIVQLFINLIAWPLFLGWGIPITPLSILGNLIFSPFLTAFLILSSLITVCNLISLPDILFIYPLEWLTDGWLWLTACPVPNCMITFIQPPLLLALLAPLGATFVIAHKFFATQERKLAGLTGLYAALMLMFSLHPQPESVTIPYGGKTVIVSYREGKLVMIDPGFTRRKSAINQWINYTLLPTLGNKFGRQTVDTLIVQKQNPSAVQAAQLLKQRAIATSIIFEQTCLPQASLQDAPVKTKPSFHASPSTRSKNPWSRNLPAPQRRVLPRAWRR